MFQNIFQIFECPSKMCYSILTVSDESVLSSDARACAPSCLTVSAARLSRQDPDTVKQRDFNVILVKMQAFDGRVALQRANECLRTNICNFIFRQVYVSERGAGQEWTVLHKLRYHRYVMHATRHDL
jgi:hypothetical protein